MTNQLFFRTCSFILIGLFCLASPILLQATCGGGGGGGHGGVSTETYKVKWLSSYDNALRLASSKNSSFLIYFEPKPKKSSKKSQEHVEYQTFATKDLSELSKEIPFAKLAFNAEDPLRLAWEVSNNKHSIHICDTHGNSLKKIEKNGVIPYTAVTKGFKAINKAVKKITKTLKSQIKKANASIKKEKYSSAIKPLQTILFYKGYDVVLEAEKLMEEVKQKGLEAADEARQEPDEKKRLKKLKTIKSKYKGIFEIKELAYLPKENRSESLHAFNLLNEKLWQEALAETSFPPLTKKEQSYQILQQGIRAEKNAQYDEAQQLYTNAAKLDPKDPIPLIYLGELERHHLGEWDQATKTFKRVLSLKTNDYAQAIALHGIGKMTIWRGDNAKGLKLFSESLKHHPTALCYRNLAVYWNTEKDFEKALGYATKAYELDPNDDYNKVFYSVYLQMDKQAEKSQELLKSANFDASMSYNYACYYAYQGDHERALSYLKKHFYEYEKYDAVRRFEMAEARMDINFAMLMDNKKFLELTSMAGDTPYLK